MCACVWNVTREGGGRRRRVYSADLSLIEESLQYTLNSRHGLILDKERAMVALDCVHLDGFCANL